MSKTRASCFITVPDTSKQMNGLSSVSRCLESVMKHEARVFHILLIKWECSLHVLCSNTYRQMADPIGISYRGLYVCCVVALCGAVRYFVEGWVVRWCDGVLCGVT